MVCLDWWDAALQEQYTMVKVIKNSGEKQIHVLRHNTMGQNLVFRQFAGEPDVYNRLLRLTHPNLPRIYQVWRRGRQTALLEEWIDGVTVFEVLESGLYVEDGARRVTSALCDALACLQQNGIIHRDIKPENVMVNAQGTVKLIDFDAARIYKPWQSEDTAVMGTMGYVAPEQLGVTQTDFRTDIYALGVLMNVMLTGKHPSVELYRGRLAKHIAKCTHINPHKRYADALELKHALH